MGARSSGCVCLILLASAACRPAAAPRVSGAASAPAVEFSLDAELRPAPLGPIARDKEIFGAVRELEKSGALRDPEIARELAGAYSGASQILIAASIPSLFRAGVLEGNVELIEFACDSANRIAHQGLRRKNSLAQYEETCRMLREPGPAVARAPAECRSAQKSLVGAYRALEAGEEGAARTKAAKGLRSLAGCGASRRLERTPAEPRSRGFIVVVVLQTLGAARATYLGGERTVPELAKEINRAYVAGAATIRGERADTLVARR